MSVNGIVGLPGSGKTQELVRKAVRSLRSGRTVYTNFPVGDRVSCALVPRDELEYSVPPQLRHSKWPTVMVPMDRHAAERAGYEHGELLVPDRKLHYVSSWDELMSIRRQRDRFGRPADQGVDVYLDELNLWAPSRMWQTLPEGLLFYWSQSRKLGLNVWWTAQHESRVDTVIREVTEFIYTSRCFFFFRPLFFYRVKYLPTQIQDSSRNTGELKGALWRAEFSFFNKKLADRYDTIEPVELSKHIVEAADRKRARTASRGAPQRALLEART